MAGKIDSEQSGKHGQGVASSMEGGKTLKGRNTGREAATNPLVYFIGQKLGGKRHPFALPNQPRSLLPSLWKGKGSESWALIP